MLKRIFGFRMWEVIGRKIKLHNEKFTVCYSVRFKFHLHNYVAYMDITCFDSYYVIFRPYFIILNLHVHQFILHRTTLNLLIILVAIYFVAVYIIYLYCQLGFMLYFVCLTICIFPSFIFK